MDHGWIIVTSPGGGIGKTLTPYLLKIGYSIIGLGSKHSKNYVDSLDSERIKFIEVNYTSESSIEEAFEQAKSFCDKIKGIIHLTGGSLLTKSIIDLSLNDFRRVVELNLDSTFLVGREAAKWMSQTGGGNMIFFGSTTGIEPSSGKMPYGVAKAGIHYMTLSFALEVSNYDIYCNTIAPSYVLTQRHKEDISEKAEKKGVSKKTIEAYFREKNPLGTILEPKDLLPTVRLLLTTQSIQGQVIRVDLGQVGI